MLVRRRPPVHPLFLAAAAFVLLMAPPVLAQQLVAPWSGVAADDARPVTGDVYWAPSTTDLSAHALSGDGRFVVFQSHAPLVADDTNDEWDVYLRDRQTNELRRVSVAIGGGDANGVSAGATISSDGRYVGFQSWANNIVEGDDNRLCDAFVYDRETGTTTRVNVSTDGEQSILWDTAAPALSSTGRFALFVSGFPSAEGQLLWLRDRDVDENGIFDEPGLMTMTEITAPPSPPSVQLFGYGDFSMSDDARFIAFLPLAYTTDWQPLGYQLLVHDRVAGTTIQVGGRHPNPNTVIYSSKADFSDSGELVYSTNEPDLVPGDSAMDEDVFVFNLYTGGYTRVQLTHDGAPLLSAARAPAISGDGRYLALVGIDTTPEGFERSNVYGVDRESGSSYEVSVTPAGTRTNRVGDYASISDDGSAIAFLAGAEVLAENWGNDGVFVATTVALSPNTIDVAAAGDTARITVTAPANTAWQVTTVDLSNQYGLLQVATPEGVGSGTIEISLPSNYTTDDRQYRVIVGSEYVTVRQPAAPTIWWNNPAEGPATGGTEVWIYGNGFIDGATVTFGGRPATDVVVENEVVIHAVTPPSAVSGTVDLVVTNPSGASAAYEGAFSYGDATPPVVSPTITGSLGLNGWYTSDVTVQWTVQDGESAVAEAECPALMLTYDAREIVASCSATSDGGAVSDQVTLNRDTTVPDIQLVLPDGGVYAQGAVAVVTYTCTDATSGIATCAGPQSSNSPLDTTHVGTATFTVTAEDRAGLQTKKAATYTVKAVPIVDVAAVSATYGSSASLRANVHTSVAPLAGLSVTFLADGVVAGSAATNASGDALFNFSLSGRNSGAVAIEAQFAGDGGTLAGSGHGVLTIVPAPLVVRANDTTKVYGQAVPAFTASATGFVNGDSFASLGGTLTFSASATATSAVGSYDVIPGGVSSPNYAIAFANGTLSVTKAQTAVTLTSMVPPPPSRGELQLRTVVSATAPGADTPSGSVEFHDNGMLIGTAPLVDGVATLNHRFRPGTHVVSATYGGSAEFIGSTTTVSLANSTRADKVGPADPAGLFF